MTLGFAVAGPIDPQLAKAKAQWKAVKAAAEGVILVLTVEEALRAERVVKEARRRR